jgi:hypothetical protein
MIFCSDYITFTNTSISLIEYTHKIAYTKELVKPWTYYLTTKKEV